MCILDHVGFDVIAGREQFPAECAQERVFPLFILYFSHPAETNDAGETVPPFAGFFTGSESTVKQTSSFARTASSLCPSRAQWK